MLTGLLRKRALLLFIACSLGAVAMAQNRKVDLKENLPFDEVLTMAKEKNKYIFLDFGSITCKPCLYIKKEVLTLDSVADFINERFVSVDYNVGKEKERLSKLYQVKGEPVLLILDQNGVLMHRMAGKMEGNQIMARFKQGLDIKNNFVSLTNTYTAGNRKPEFIMQYLEALYAAAETETMNKVTLEYLQGPVERIKDPGIWSVFYKYNQDLASREVMYMFENKEEFYKLFGKDKVDAKINKLFSEKSIFYLYGHKPPIEDPKYTIILNALRKTDHPKASEWLCYLVPAQYKYKDWHKLGQEIDNIYSFNILKGKAGTSFKDMMLTQYSMYCDENTALKYPIRWANDLIATAATEAEKKKYEGIKANFMKREKEPNKEKLDWSKSD
ncbi:thioredoxin family protein [Pedobacter insulae]|uniref:Thioredoxin-like n=1 Tax=Pedobacter insulae TaxID=414048 RepID=A0A1I2STX5_9SPHI|nr:thioredoxin family protein [Pedobacter insulae]SFG56172.1 Thioredoxin-like [Pedobacter insulae]